MLCKSLQVLKDNAGNEYPNKYVIRDWGAFEVMCKFLFDAPVLIFDFETSGLDWYAHARACGIGLGSWGSDGTLISFYVPFRHDTGESQLTISQIYTFISQLLGNLNTLKIAHNIKFDEHIAACDKWLIGGPRYDTMIAARLYDENRSAALKNRAIEDLNRPNAADFEKRIYEDVYKRAKKIKMPINSYRSKYGYSQIDIETLGLYCCFDIEFTGQLYQFYEKKNISISASYPRIWATEMRLTKILGEMEVRGMKIDTNYLEGLREALGGVLASLEDSIKHQLGGLEFRLSSDAELRDVLTTKLGLKLSKLTKGNKLSVDKEVLAQFVAVHPVIQSIIEWKEAEKLYSTYTASILERLDDNKVLHTDFQQVGTFTGRLSCKNPNLQNQPSDSDKRSQQYYGKSLEAGGKDPWSIRRAYIVRDKGWVRLFFDYSQIELRVLAFYTKDPVLVNAYVTGEDIHERTSLEVFGTKDKAKRRLAKVINFGLSYGLSGQGFAAQTGMSLEDACKYLNIFFDRYRGITNFRIKFWNEVRKNKGYFQNIFGRPRYIKNIGSNIGYERSKAERQAIGTLIQGTAAELTKEALVRIDDYFKRENVPAYVVSTVHDEIQIDSEIAAMACVSREVKRLMEDFPEFAPIPIIAEVEYTTTTWADKKKIII